MAHPPGVAYNAQRAARKPADVRVDVETPPAPKTSPSPGDGNGGRPVNVALPDLSAFNPVSYGDTLLEKGLIVLAILIIGIGLYSKMTGAAFNWSLQGFAAKSATGRGGIPAWAQRYYAMQDRRVGLATDTMATRMNVANPARVMT